MFADEQHIVELGPLEPTKPLLDGHILEIGLDGQNPITPVAKTLLLELMNVMAHEETIPGCTAADSQRGIAANQRRLGSSHWTTCNWTATSSLSISSSSRICVVKDSTHSRCPNWWCISP